MLSAVVLTHNDERTIARTLASLSWADELIVVDDRSNDKTTDIAKQQNALVYTRELSDNFSVQRNFALAKASGDWVLFVDSDEVVSEALRDEILEAVRSPLMQGYAFKRTDMVFGRLLTHGETGNVRLVRLGRKDAGTWKRNVHETWQIRGAIGEMDHPILHFPHPDVAQFIEDVDRYSTLHAKTLYAEGVHTHGWEVILYPAAKFFVAYILRLGFLDGMAGLVVAIIMSFHSFLARSKLYLLAKTKT